MMELENRVANLEQCVNSLRKTLEQLAGELSNKVDLIHFTNEIDNMKT
ncbi:hypothetical protein U2I54_19200 [Bacillus pseudomycoides]|uniref:Degradation enzyme regulation protein DegQ n=1 Tax=Bacillus bingmayongensis TaxID=1150157 RepID=A0ABU5K0D1_9BACI|nr:hypothetical protein [Bacillus pseudomycoides]